MQHDPTEQDAADCVRKRLELDPASVTRFVTGLANYVYEVQTPSGDSVVVRLNRARQGGNFASAVYWYHRLVRQDVPLPRLLSYDPSPPDGSFPFMIITRLAGQDLDSVYPVLTAGEKRGIAWALADIQVRVGYLPLAPGFGFARSYEDPALHPSWAGFLYAELQRSRTHIERLGMVDSSYTERVAAKLVGYQSYFATVEPRGFLDDIALKNVLIHNGTLSGIVDTDWVCFGDALLPVALTKARLLWRNWNMDYISYWEAALELDEERRSILSLYTALWLVNSLALVGRRFSNNLAVPVNGTEIPALTRLLDHLLPLI